MRCPPPPALPRVSLLLCLLLPALPLPLPLSLPRRREPPDRRPLVPVGTRHREEPTLELSPADAARGVGGWKEPPALPPIAPQLGHESRTGGRRGKRHAARFHHGQLMRVGCVLGTCQVQNLSHRLWQLMGQSGRQDSSPMNPNSPHSYG
ncbi:protein ADM2 [Alligator mississippiensis]|uniref:protein ADM2 n=1 Tax=Alligator mississippiensis TaxID=8496 RepID=UPI002877C04B|nr:protein ADM2 [Alligator mississippiensis]